MYNKENFAVGKVASKDQYKQNLNSIYCHPKFTVGCSGPALMIVTTPKMDIEEMPSPQNEELVDKFEPFILDLNDAKKVEKSIPKKTSLPLLSHVAILKSENGNAKFFTTDLQSQNITVSRKIDGEYPQFGKVFPKGKPIKTMRFDTRLLKTLIDAIESAQGSPNTPHVDIDIYDNGNEGVVMFKSNNIDTGQRITALLMPLRK